MERKVGEIFEYNGEWYQCIHTKYFGCENCNLTVQNNIHCIDAFKIRGECLSSNRKDGKSVIFKKLEKVGEPEIINGKKVQSIVTGYVGCAFCIFKKGGACLSGGTCKNRGTRIYVEIKQNKEDMEEKKLTYEELEHYYDSTCGLWAIDRDPKQVTLEWIVENAFQLGDTIPEKVCASNLKPFDLEAAKAGKPVCTRDGRKARIICFDAKCNKPIVALIYDCNKETVLQYLENGRFFVDQIDKYDLMMLPQKKEGWVNVYKSYNVGKKIPCMASIYPTKEEAKKSSVVGFDYVDTVKIEWEE